VFSERAAAGALGNGDRLWHSGGALQAKAPTDAPILAAFLLRGHYQRHVRRMQAYMRSGWRH
jgi:hypothetical protein